MKTRIQATSVDTYRVYTYRILRPFAAVVVLSLVAFAAAAQEGDDWRIRLIGSWNEPIAGSESSGDSPDFELVGRQDGEWGIGLAVERRLGRSLGFEVGYEQTGLGIDLVADSSTGVVPGFTTDASFDSTTAWVGLDWHFYERGAWDLWAGPVVAQVAWDDFTFVVPELDARARFRSGDDVVAGAQLGLAVGSGRWSFVSTLRYLDYSIDADADETGEAGLQIDVDPLQFAAGVGFSF